MKANVCNISIKRLTCVTLRLSNILLNTVLDVTNMRALFFVSKQQLIPIHINITNILLSFCSTFPKMLVLGERVFVNDSKNMLVETCFSRKSSLLVCALPFCKRGPGRLVFV